MLANSIDTLKRERAAFARNTEYVKETAFDDIIDARTEIAESKYSVETSDELKEAVDMVNRLPADEDLVSESAEIDALLNADHDLTFEEMVGIE